MRTIATTDAPRARIAGPSRARAHALPASLAATLLGALLAVLSVAPAPARAATVDADPALWVVRDADTTIYLFGTVHLLPPGLGWFDEAVADAFRRSDELRIEVVEPEDPAALAPLLLQLAMDPDGRTLSERLTPAQRERYAAAMASAGLPAEALEGFEPWFVGLQLSLGVLGTIGAEPGLGVERVLVAAAESSGKRIDAFETVEQQLGWLDATPEREQIASLMEVADDPQGAARQMRELIDRWSRGDPEGAGDLMNESLAATPETARLLLTDRNRRWADEIRARLDRPGTVFVAVGAGHLAGRDSVQDFLAAKGLKVTRIEY